MLLTIHSCLSNAQIREIWMAGAAACRDCALVVVPCALFVAGARESSCFGGPKWTFRDRRKGSKWIYLEVPMVSSPCLVSSP